MKTMGTLQTILVLLMSSWVLTGADALARPALRVVLDPGHGGSDFGTVYESGRTRIAEKDITLKLAREAARQLRERGFEVLLTREKDEDVALPVRTAMANRARAHLFLSIHLNSTATPMVSDAEGIETFILNTASDATSKRIAQLENKLFDPAFGQSPHQSDVALILKDLNLDANLSDSKKLACAVQQNLAVTSSNIKLAVLNSQPNPPAALLSAIKRQQNRGVKQAMFYVLLGADMPSTLVEAGFLTNPRDRAIVLSPSGQQAIGGALARAVERYHRERLIPQHLSELSRCKVH